MNEKAEQRIAARLAKVMGMMCVRNVALIENLHAGLVPVSRTGDFTDVIVVDANGRRIPWPEVSHFDNDAMRDLIRGIVDRLYTFYRYVDDPRLHDEIKRWQTVSDGWDDPSRHKGLMRTVYPDRDVDSNE